MTFQCAKPLRVIFAGEKNVHANVPLEVRPMSPISRGRTRKSLQFNPIFMALGNQTPLNFGLYLLCGVDVVAVGNLLASMFFYFPRIICGHETPQDRDAMKAAAKSMESKTVYLLNEDTYTC